MVHKLPESEGEGFMVHKLPESEGESRRQGLFMAINPWLPWFICYILKQIGSVGP